MGKSRRDGTCALHQVQVREVGISPDRIAGVLAFAIDQPEDAAINELMVGPANQPW